MLPVSRGLELTRRKQRLKCAVAVVAPASDLQLTTHLAIMLYFTVSTFCFPESKSHGQQINMAARIWDI